MKASIKIAVITAIWWVFAYTLFTFLQWQPNPKYWAEYNRFLLVITCLIILLVNIVIVNHEQQPETP